MICTKVGTFLLKDFKSCFSTVLLERIKTEISDDDDEFVCGRAYGGDSVAVVSSARYHPLLDAVQEIDREHDWPASHCNAFLKKMCAKGESDPKPAKRKRPRKTVSDSSNDPIIS